MHQYHPHPLSLLFMFMTCVLTLLFPLLITFLPPTTAFPACSRLGEQNCIPPFIIRCFRHPEVLQYWGFLTNRIWCLAWKTRNKIKHLKVFMFSILTRWWFQPNLMFIRFFSGEMIQFHKQILQNGLVQPPTSWRFQPLSLFRWNLSTKGMGFVWKGLYRFLLLDLRKIGKSVKAFGSFDFSGVWNGFDKCGFAIGCLTLNN